MRRRESVRSLRQRSRGLAWRAMVVALGFGLAGCIVVHDHEHHYHHPHPYYGPP